MTDVFHKIIHTKCWADEMQYETKQPLTRLPKPLLLPDNASHDVLRSSLHSSPCNFEQNKTFFQSTCELDALSLQPPGMVNRFDIRNQSI